MTSMVKLEALVLAVRQVLLSNPQNEANVSYKRFVLQAQVVEEFERRGKFDSAVLEALKKHPKESLESETPELSATQHQGPCYILYDPGVIVMETAYGMGLGGMSVMSILSVADFDLSNAALWGVLIPSGAFVLAWGVDKAFKLPLDEDKE